MLLSIAVLLQIILVAFVAPMTPLLITQRWDWWEAWVFAFAWTVCFVLSRTLAERRHPGILEERAKSMQRDDVQTYDKILAPLLGLGSIVVPVVAGLDARFSWSSLVTYPAAVKAVSLVLLLAGYAISSYALVENRFFSGVMRMQTDRGHKVVTTGPYAWVRHPGYTGLLFVLWGTPPLLDSPWAFVAVAFLSIATLVRTELEDKTLQKQLEGYLEYTERVRYRLLPKIW